MKLLQITPNPKEGYIQTFINKIKEIESLDLAFEHQRSMGRNKVRIIKENTENVELTRNTRYVHELCGKNHKRGECTYVCSGCKQRGSHKPEGCWELHPHLKPARLRRKEERGRWRER